jgi:hypothetical protein
MKFTPKIPGRRSIRLKDYDYTQPGGYFITVCTQDRECLLGEVREGEMIPNRLGKIVLHVWDELPIHYPNVELDTFCVMPNHFHGIIILTERQDNSVGAGRLVAGWYDLPYGNRTSRTTRDHIKSFSAHPINLELFRGNPCGSVIITNTSSAMRRVEFHRQYILGIFQWDDQDKSC